MHKILTSDVYNNSQVHYSAFSKLSYYFIPILLFYKYHKLVLNEVIL